MRARAIKPIGPITRVPSIGRFNGPEAMCITNIRSLFCCAACDQEASHKIPHMKFLIKPWCTPFPTGLMAQVRALELGIHSTCHTGSGALLFLARLLRVKRTNQQHGFYNSSAAAATFAPVTSPVHLVGDIPGYDNLMTTPEEFEARMRDLLHKVDEAMNRYPNLSRQVCRLANAACKLSWALRTS